MSDLSKKLRQMKLPNGYNAEVLPEAAARVEELERVNAELLEALKALRTMTDRGPQPRKLDDALTWLGNDEMARAMTDAAIASAEALTGETK